MDETEIDNNDFLNKALESAEERYKKLSEKNSVHRVDIRRFAETLTKQERNEFYQALDELKKDDELKVKQIDDGSVIVKFKASGDKEIMWHIFKWGDKVKILAPDKLKKEYQNTLKQILEINK